MIHDIPVLRSLDPHHQRLGYLGALAAVGVRTLDTQDALVARFRDLLFERLYTDDTRLAEAMSRADPDVKDRLRDLMVRDLDEDPASILAPLDRSAGWLTRSECWLYDSRMPSHLGYLAPKHASRTVDLAKWTGVLLPTLELSEMGFLLQHLVRGRDEDWNRETNILVVQSRPALALLYLRLLLPAELLFIALIEEFIARTHSRQRLATRGDDGLLRHAIARLRDAIGEPSDPEDVLPFHELRAFEEATLKTKSTEENYLRPRLEMLVDLGVVSRRSEDSVEKAGAFPWQLPDSTLSLRTQAAWVRLSSQPQTIDEFLDTEFIGTWGPFLGLTLRPPSSDAESLLWFCRAYEDIQREIGFTPGRSVALLASYLAAEAGVRFEIKEIYRLIYSLPESRYARFVSFSGGSRFDSEFLIKIDPALIDALRNELQIPSERNGNG